MRSGLTLLLVPCILVAGTNATPVSRRSPDSRWIALQNGQRAASHSETLPLPKPYAQVPLSFEANLGQADHQVKFVSRADEYSLFLTSTEAVLQLPKEHAGSTPLGDVTRAESARALPPKTAQRESSALRIRLTGSNPRAVVVGVDELPTRTHYFLGPDPAKWQTDVPSFARVKYHSVYPGVDLVFYGNQRMLEYDFIVAPHSDPSPIELSFDGADKLELTAAGDLLVHMKQDQIRLQKPSIYQQTNSGNREISGGYDVRDNHCVTFKLGTYDPNQPLVIDPVVYATYLGGREAEYVNAIAADTAGNAYVTGQSFSRDFPTANGLQPNCTLGSLGGCTDAFIAKINPAGSAFVYSTYFGGTGNDSGQAIAVDSSGNAYVTGSLDSNQAFIVKLDPAGKMVYQRTLTGYPTTIGRGIAVDNSGNAYVTGETLSTSFPTRDPIQANPGGGYCSAIGGGSFPVDAFVTKLNPAGELVYSTLLGGNGNDRGLAVAVDSDGSAYVAGETSSNDFPLKNAVRSNYQGAGPRGPGQCGGDDGFVAKLNPAGSALVFSTYHFRNRRIVSDLNGIVYTGDRDLFPAFDSTGIPYPKARPFYRIGADAAGNVYSLCTSADAVDSLGNVYRADSVNADYATVNALQPVRGGPTDAYITKLSECATPLAIAPSASAGITQFVPIVLSSAGANGSFYSSELTLTNPGAEASTLRFTYTPAFGGGAGGSATDLLPAGRQRVIPDAIDYLKSIGLPIPDAGDRGGTLAVQSSNSEAAVTVRTTTSVPEGRAGLAYPGIPLADTLSEPSYLFGLRQSATDRTNVALQNAGSPQQGDIVLRLTVFSGGSGAIEKVLPDEALSPGGFKQISSILSANGLALANGYVRIERVSGRAPYYAYAVINDQITSDGSFVSPVLESVMKESARQVLPVAVETSRFRSELVVTNLLPVRKQVLLSYVADAIPNRGFANVVVDIAPGQQLIIPAFVEYLREVLGLSVIPGDVNYAGTVVGTQTESPWGGLYLGSRTTTPGGGGGGQFSLFCNGVSPIYDFPPSSAWIFGLRQDSETRTNLALANTGFSTGFTIELFDGETGLKVSTIDGIILRTFGWLQFTSILAQYAPGTNQGYARITRTSGSDDFIAYAVINDGGRPGERSGDGAFVRSSMAIPVVTFPGAPVQLSPKNSAALSNDLLTTTLQWSKVLGAAKYGVEIDYFGGKWCSEVEGCSAWKDEVFTNRYIFNFVGAQPGRWRVWAIDALGNKGAVSDWWHFTYAK